MHAQDEHRWSIDDNAWTVKELSGSRALILGAGNIGRALATKAVGLGLEVEVIGRNRRASFIEGATYRTIDELDDALPHADHVVIGIPLTPETLNLFDAHRLARMKPGSVIYNVGRGPILNTDALIAALESGHLGRCGYRCI